MFSCTEPGVKGLAEAAPIPVLNVYLRVLASDKTLIRGSSLHWEGGGESGHGRAKSREDLVTITDGRTNTAGGTDARFESGLVETILRPWTEAASGAVCVGSNRTGGAFDYQVIWPLNWPYAKSLRSQVCSRMPPYAALDRDSRNISRTARQALPHAITNK